MSMDIILICLFALALIVCGAAGIMAMINAGKAAREKQRADIERLKGEANARGEKIFAKPRRSNSDVIKRL